MRHPFLLGLAAFGWRLGLLLLAIIAAAVMVFGNPDRLKSSLSDSGAYDKAADRLIVQAGDTVSSETGSATDRQLIDDTARQNLKPESLRTAVEQNVDNTYLWLEGRSATPDLTLDLRPYVSGFTNSLGDQAVRRAEAAPACTPEQLRQFDPATVDVFNLACRPPGIDLNQARDLAISRAVASNELLRNPVLTNDSLPKDGQGRTIVDRASNLPTAYQWAKRAPWLFGGLALLSAGVICLLLRNDWRAAAGKLARSLLGVGISLIVIALLVRLSIWYTTRPDSLAAKLAGGEFSQVILTFTTSLLKALVANLLWFCLAYLTIAAITLLLLRFLKPPVTGAGKARPGTAGSL